MIKKKVPAGWIKISEFERLTGLNNRTVALAIQAGKIPAQYVKQIGDGATSPKYIHKKKAAVNWYQNINANHHLSRTLRESLAKYIRSFDPTIIGEGKNPPAKTKAESKTEILEPENISFSEAQRREKVAKAKVAELELKEKEGELVQKAVIYEQLYAAGKELRDTLLSIPDRIIDQVIAASENRAKALNTVYDAIALELEKLSDWER